MEYVFVNPWKKSLDDGKIDEAINMLEHQIALNLFNIHNKISDKELTKLADVYNVFAYAHSNDGNSIDALQPFADIASKFYSVLFLRDSEFDDKDERTIQYYKEIEDNIIEELKKLDEE